MQIINSVIEGNTESLLAYLSGGGDPNFSEDWAAVTLLHHAVSVRNLPVICMLLTWRADPLLCEQCLDMSAYELTMALKWEAGAILMAPHIIDRQH